MISSYDQQSYLLSYRRDDVEEDRRLNSQHEVIKYAILNNLLIHLFIYTLNL